MSNFILYSLPTCPQCKMIHLMLDNNKIKYTECQDVDIMRSKNITQIPVLEVGNNRLLVGKEIFTWVREQK